LFYKISKRVDAYFKSHLSIVVDNPEVAYPNVNTVWAAFSKRFGYFYLT
jgi:hypothetical protein